MTERSQETTQPQMAHGHTRLIWLLDDIDAHLDGLSSADSEDQALILEELVSFTRAFHEELDGHIAEEEADIFPLAEAVATAEERSELEDINQEHRKLESMMKSFWQVLSQHCEETSARRHEPCCDQLFEQVRSIREHLVAHSAHERNFLMRVEPRVEDSSIKV